MNEWINVEDRLPETIGHYLIYYNTGMEKNVAWAFFTSQKRWAGGNMFYENITHWMPLPKPPRGGLQ